MANGADIGRRLGSIVMVSVLVIGSLASGVGLIQVAGDEADDWPTFSHDNRNSGHNPNTTGPVSEVTERWNFTTGHRVRTAPAVVDGTVYFGSDDAKVYALNAEDGTERWNFTTGSFLRSSPAVVNDTVYVGSTDRDVYALNASDGTKRWNFTTSGAVRSSPAVVADTVYVGSSAKVYALNATDGTERWNFSTSAGGVYTPAVADGTVFIGGNIDNVYALDASDGTKRWNFSVGAAVRSAPAVVDGTVYFGSDDDNVYALNAADGTERWNFSTGNNVYPSPAVVNNTVYIGSWDNNVYALNAEDGTERWNFTTGDDVGSSPAVVNDTVYIGSEDRDVYALNASDGTKRWSFTTGLDVVASPSVVDGVVYIGSDDRKLYALEEASPDDSTPPQLLDSIPSAAETDVTSDTEVTLRFDEPVQAGSGQLYLNRTSDGSVLESVPIGSSDVSVDGPNVTWTRSSDLPAGTDVYIYVPEGVILDLADNAWPGINDATTLNFATGTGDWSTFSYDNRNAGYNPHTTGPESDVMELWNFTAGSSVRSSPTVVNGTVYVGSDDDNLYALNAADGSVEWDFRTGNGILSSPAVVDDTVYVGSLDWEVYALNATDGTKRWNFSAAPMTSSPAVVDNTVYIIASRTLYALNGTDGTERWNFSIGLGQRMSPAVADDTVFAGGGNGIVYALNATDGTKRWDFDTGDGVRSSPAVVDDTVYVGSTAGEVYALNATSGTKKWNFTTGNEVFASPAVADGVVYVGSFDRDVYALNASDGAKRWNFTTGSIIASSAAVVNGTVYVGSNDNNVYALDAADGTKRWNFTTGFQVVSSPAVVDGVVYVGSSDNKVYALGEARADSTSPEITDLSVQVIDTRTIFVSFDSNESLDAVKVEVEDQTGTVVKSLTTSDFGSIGADPIEYFGETTLDTADTYTVTLTTAADTAGNDGASDQNVTVQLVVEDVSMEHVSGTAPDMANLTSTVYLSQGPGGLLQVQLRDASDPTADVVNRTDLENLGVESDTTLAVNVTLVDWTPRLLLGTGHNLSWTTTDVGANVTTLNLTVQPAEIQLIESQLLNPDQPWPTGANDRADVRMNATVDLAVDDMGLLADPVHRDAVDGTVLATDAQAFGTPQFDTANNTLSLFVAGPHLTVDGENHTGFYDAFLPDALLEEWGVEDASDLTVAFQGDAIDFVAQHADGGIELAIDLTYSAGDVTISSTDSEPDTGSEPAPVPAPQSPSDSDPEPDDEPEQTKTVEIDDSGDNVTVRKTVEAGNASANTTVSLDVSVEPDDDPENATEDQDVTLNRLNVTMNRTADISLTITESADPPTDDSATFEVADGTELLGYIRIDHDLDDEDVGEVELEFRVRKGLLDEAGDDPEHVALYRLEGDEWAELPTDLVGETNTHYVFKAVSPGLSEFATGAKRAKFEIADAQVSVAEIHTGDDFEVVVRITNIGGVDGTYTAELWIEGDLVADQTVTVASGGTRQVTFDHGIETPGSYEVRVNDRSTGRIHVLEVTPTPAGATPTPAPAETPDGTDPEPSEEPTWVPLPGFGMGVALVALAIAALLAVRRRD